MMVDLSFLEKFTKGDTNKMSRYIRLYLQVAPDTFNKMEENLRERDWKQLRINAHSLKPQADYMGIPALKNILMQIENDVVQERYDSLPRLVGKAIAVHSASEVTLKSALQ